MSSQWRVSGTSGLSCETYQSPGFALLVVRLIYPPGKPSLLTHSFKPGIPVLPCLYPENSLSHPIPACHGLQSGRSMVMGPGGSQL